MFDEDENDLTNGDFDTTYNRNDRQNRWEKDKSNWESVEFTCRAYGGRPEPQFKWYIENNNNDDLQEVDNFRINEARLSCEDRYSYICNMESKIEFTIDDKLMEYLETLGIDVNPKDDNVRFELNCEADQGTSSSFVEQVSVELNIQKR